jgi:hypothetical protein
MQLQSKPRPFLLKKTSVFAGLVAVNSLGSYKYMRVHVFVVFIRANGSLAVSCVNRPPHVHDGMAQYYRCSDCDHITLVGLLDSLLCRIS